MHEYTKTESKYTSKIGTHNIWKQMYIILLKLKIMPSEARLKNLNLKNKHTFYVNNHSPNIFPVLTNFPVSEQISPCFPCLEKVRTKFPVFPVPWPLCVSKICERPPGKLEGKLIISQQSQFLRNDKMFNHNSPTVMSSKI